MISFSIKKGQVVLILNIPSGHGVSKMEFNGFQLKKGMSQEAFALATLLEHYIDSTVKKNLQAQYLQGYYAGRMKKAKRTFEQAPCGMDDVDEIDLEFVHQLVKDDVI